MIASGIIRTERGETMKTDRYASICKKTGIATRLCQHCKRAEQLKRARRPMTEKILDVLEDHEVHSTREVAEQAGLMKDGKYPDIQRAIRLLRQEGKPVECVDAAASMYKFLTPEEEVSTDFWKRHEERTPKTKEVADLEARVLKLEKENEFLSDYATECDEEIKRLKSGFVAA